MFSLFPWNQDDNNSNNINNNSASGVSTNSDDSRRANVAGIKKRSSKYDFRRLPEKALSDFLFYEYDIDEDENYKNEFARLQERLRKQCCITDATLRVAHTPILREQLREVHVMLSTERSKDNNSPREKQTNLYEDPVLPDSCPPRSGTQTPERKLSWESKDTAVAQSSPQSVRDVIRITHH